jgi:hypothetical protein
MRCALLCRAQASERPEGGKALPQIPEEALVRADRRRIEGVCQREPGLFTEVLRIKVLIGSDAIYAG